MWHMQPPQYLIVPFLQAFFWLDDGLQKYLQSRGWSQVTRPQSMVMINVLSGVTATSDGLCEAPEGIDTAYQVVPSQRAKPDPT